MVYSDCEGIPLEVSSGDTGSSSNLDDRTAPKGLGVSRYNDHFPLAYAGRVIRQAPFENVRDPNWDPFYPFSLSLDYKLARWYVETKTPATKIDQLFKSVLGRHLPDINWKSSYKLKKTLEEMAQGPSWKEGSATYTLSEGETFYYRDVKKCIEYLLRQRAYAKDMVWEPIQDFDFECKQRYLMRYSRAYRHFLASNNRELHISRSVNGRARKCVGSAESL